MHAKGWHPRVAWKGLCYTSIHVYNSLGYETYNWNGRNWFSIDDSTRLMLPDMGLPKVQLPWHKLKRGAKWKHDKTHLGAGVGSKFRPQCWGMPNVPKILVMGQWNGSFYNKKNCVCTPSLINRTIHRYPNSN
jgi:hypothetical protein